MINKCMRSHFDFDISTQLYIVYILLQTILFKNKFYFLFFSTYSLYNNHNNINITIIQFIYI